MVEDLEFDPQLLDGSEMDEKLQQVFDDRAE